MQRLVAQALQKQDWLHKHVMQHKSPELRIDTPNAVRGGRQLRAKHLDNAMTQRQW